MIVVVYDLGDNEEIFYGNADEFLEMNGYDEEIEEALNELETKRVGDSVKIYGNQSDVFSVVKEEEEIIWN